MATRTKSWIHGKAAYVNRLPAGTITLSDTMVFENLHGPELRGTGEFLTTIVWKGPVNKPVISFRSCHTPKVNNITFKFDNAARSAVCVSTMPQGLAAVTNTHARIEDVWIEGAGLCGIGMELNNIADNGTDNNGERHDVKGCTITGCPTAAVYVGSSQAHSCRIVENQIYDCGVGVLGTGSIWIEGNQGYGLDCFAKLVDQYAAGGMIRDNNFETTKRFVDLRFNSARGKWTVDHNRVHLLSLSGAAGEFETAAVFLQAYGYIDFRSNLFLSQGDYAARFVTHGVKGLSFEGNGIECYGTTPDPTFSVIAFGMQPATWNRNTLTRIVGASQESSTIDYPG